MCHESVETGRSKGRVVQQQGKVYNFTTIYGLAVYAAVTLFGRQWEMGAALAGACIAAALITSKRWSPALAWKKWRIARMRRRLSVIEGGVKPTRKRDEHTYLN